MEGENGLEELVAVIPGAVWDKIRDSKDIPAEILSAADLGGGVARVLVQEILARELDLRDLRSGFPPGPRPGSCSGSRP